jgi:hypothetical protein
MSGAMKPEMRSFCIRRIMLSDACKEKILFRVFGAWKVDYIPDFMVLLCSNIYL